MDRTEIEDILASETDVERAKAKIEGLLAAERLKLEQERSDREEERLIREKRRWYANPLFVAVSVGALTLLGDAIVSSVQGTRDLELQKQRAASDLIRSAFVDDPQQTIQNLEFMIAAQLIEDAEGAIIAAAERFSPRETVAATPQPEVVRGVFGPRVARVGTIERIIDGDSLRVRFSGGFEGGPTPRISSSGAVTVALAGVDAAEVRTLGCDRDKMAATTAFGELARAEAQAFIGSPEAPARMLFLLTEVSSFGRLHAIVAPLTRAQPEPLAMYDASLNRLLARKGLAIPSEGERLPEGIEARIRSDIRQSEEARLGMFSNLTRRVDLDAEDMGVLPSWLLRRACFILRSEKSADAYFADYFANVQVHDADTGAVLDASSFIKVEGNVIEQLRPMHSVRLEYEN